MAGNVIFRARGKLRLLALLGCGFRLQRMSSTTRRMRREMHYTRHFSLVVSVTHRRDHTRKAFLWKYEITECCLIASGTIARNVSFNMKAMLTDVCIFAQLRVEQS